MPPYSWKAGPDEVSSLRYSALDRRIGKSGGVRWQQDHQSEYRSAIHFKELKLKDFLAYLEEGNFPADRERYLRLHTWWTGNDEHRRNTEVQMYMTDADKANLEVLIELLDDENQSDLLMKAEAYRELGKFEEAKEVLLKCDPSFAPEATDAIWQLCVKRDGFVREISG